MKKSISFILAAFMILTFSLVSCRKTQPEEVTTETSPKPVDDLYFIKRFVNQSNSLTNLNVDIKDIFKGKWSEFEISVPDDDFQIAYKNGVMLTNGNQYRFFTDDGLTVEVHTAEDNPEEIIYTDVGSFMDSFDLMNGDVDAGFFDVGFIDTIEISSLLHKKNFIIEGNKYTLKEEVLKAEIRKVFEEMMGEFDYDDESDYDDEFGDFMEDYYYPEFDFEEVYDEIMNSITKLELSFTKKGETELSAMQFVMEMEYLEVYMLIDFEIRIEKNKLTGLEVNMKDDKYSEESSFVLELSIGYDTDNTVKTVDFEMDSSGYSEIPFIDMYDDLMMVTYPTKTTAKLKYDAAKLDEANVKVLEFTSSVTPIVNEENLAYAEAKTGRHMYAVMDFLNDFQNENRTEVLLETTGANFAVISLTSGEETVYGTVKFSTDELSSIPASVSKAKNDALEMYGY